jgi:hypothetical protein
MTDRLLERQARLLEYLASGAAIFGDNGDGRGDPTLLGIDPALLRLEAGFSHAKRMAKIATVFPRTLEILDVERDAILRAFAEACPAADIRRIANARQFCDFVAARCRRQPGQTPFLPDVAACELACAQVRSVAEDEDPRVESNGDVPPGSIRRRPGIVLLRCSHDVRPIFEGEARKSPPSPRDVRLAVAMPPGAPQPLIFELLPAVFDLLAALEDWTDRATFGATPQLQSLVDELTDSGLIEVRG